MESIALISYKSIYTIIIIEFFFFGDADLMLNMPRLFFT